MSRPVAGKNKKGEGRPRAAVKKTNEKTILPSGEHGPEK